MKKILLIIGIIINLNLSANNIIMSWNCGGLIVSLCETNNMYVGDLRYEMYYPSDNKDIILLIHGGRPMLEVRKTGPNRITIINVDNRRDRKTFVKCK